MSGGGGDGAAAAALKRVLRRPIGALQPDQDSMQTACSYADSKIERSRTVFT